MKLGRVRGKDLAWLKIHEFETTLDYLSSDIFKELAGGKIQVWCLVGMKK